MFTGIHHLCNLNYSIRTVVGSILELYNWTIKCRQIYLAVVTSVVSTNSVNFAELVWSWKLQIHLLLKQLLSIVCKMTTVNSTQFVSLALPKIFTTTYGQTNPIGNSPVLYNGSRDKCGLLYALVWIFFWPM